MPFGFPTGTTISSSLRANVCTVVVTTAPAADSAAIGSASVAKRSPWAPAWTAVARACEPWYVAVAVEPGLAAANWVSS